MPTHSASPHADDGLAERISAASADAAPMPLARRPAAVSFTPENDWTCRRGRRISSPASCRRCHPVLVSGRTSDFGDEISSPPYSSPLHAVPRVRQVMTAPVHAVSPFPPSSPERYRSRDGTMSSSQHGEPPPYHKIRREARRAMKRCRPSHRMTRHFAISARRRPALMPATGTADYGHTFPRHERKKAR